MSEKYALVPVERQWTHDKPATPGGYWVRGFRLGEPDSRPALIEVARNEKGELLCNINDSNTNDDTREWSFVEDLAERFEWCGPLAAAPAPVAEPVQQAEQKPFAYSFNYARCVTCSGPEDWVKLIERERPADFLFEDGRVTDFAPLYTTPQPASAPGAVSVPAFDKIVRKLQRFEECAEDSGSGGVDIGRHWLDLLTQLGLLNRVQRSPGLWEISQQGEDLLSLHERGGEA